MDVREFGTQVEQGNLRYKLNTKIQATVYVQGFEKVLIYKSFNVTRTLQEGVFNADNDEIHQKCYLEAFLVIL